MHRGAQRFEPRRDTATKDQNPIVMDTLSVFRTALASYLEQTGTAR